MHRREMNQLLFSAAAVDLNHRGTYLHWGILSISAANLVVIAVMLAIFLLAIFLPFPGTRRRTR